MLFFPRWKKICVWLVVATGLWLALPNSFSEPVKQRIGMLFPENRIALGLDLQGGSHLLLQVEMAEYLREYHQGSVDTLRTKMRQERLGYTGLSALKNGATFTVREMTDIEAVEAMLRDFRAEYTYEIAEGGVVTLELRPEERERITRQVLAQSIEIVRRRVDETGTREPIIARQGDDRIVLQVPGLKNPEMLKSLLGKTAKMTFHLMDETQPFVSQRVPARPGYMVLPGEGDKNFYHILRKIELSGELLVDASVTFDQGMPVVNFRFNTRGGKLFGDITKNNVGKPFAIVLDGKVISAPRINSPILGGSGIISGNFTVESANELAMLLRSGALPAPLTVIEERTVGPSLGEDSILAGKKAALIGVCLVMITMFLIYRRFGIYSNIALLVNMVLLFAVLTLFQATLTLPGIAGMVLTMGMAVDANVLIFERIREEIRLGKTPYAAIDLGFSQAFRTILDANITTLIATILLFILGSGPVKGFAVTLCIGILVSMFSAILFTRMLVVQWLVKHKPKTLVL